MSAEPIPLQVQEVPEKELQFDITWSPTIGKLAEALAKAQLKYKPIVKSTDNAAYVRGGKASKYADLAEYLDATQEALASEGLVVTQWPAVSTEAKSMSLISVLIHSSGEWMKGRLTLPATGRDGFTPQSCGSSITYARRYSYSAITGCASEDDDGNAASGIGSREAAQAVAARKIAEFEAKKKEDLTEKLQESLEHNQERSLFYVWHEESQTATIMGDEALKKLNKDVLRQYWNGAAKALVVTGEQLEALKYTLEQRNVQFQPLKVAK